MEYEENLTDLYRTVQEMNKEREDLLREKSAMEELIDAMERKLQEESQSAERYDRRLKHLREENDKLQEKISKLYQENTTMNFRSIQTTQSCVPTQQATSKLVEAYEKQLEEKTKDLKELREKVREIEDIYRRDVRNIQFQIMKGSEATLPKRDPLEPKSQNRREQPSSSHHQLPRNESKELKKVDTKLDLRGLKEKNRRMDSKENNGHDSASTTSGHRAGRGGEKDEMIGMFRSVS